MDESYFPRWRALLLARVRLGEEAKLWRRGSCYCVGVITRRVAPGKTEVRLLGEGSSWRDAVDASTAARSFSLRECEHAATLGGPHEGRMIGY